MWAAFRTKKVSRSAGALTPIDCIVRTISLLRADDVPATSLDKWNITSIHMATEIYFIASLRFISYSFFSTISSKICCSAARGCRLASSFVLMTPMVERFSAIESTNAMSAFSILSVG